MLEKQRYNLFIRGDISIFKTTAFDKQGNSPLDLNAGATEERDNWN